MNILLIFFAIPVAVIILSAIFETFIRCPIKVTGITFAIFLIVAFALGGTAELIVAAIIYTIISFITAFIVCLIRTRESNNCCNNNSNFVNTASVIETATTGNIVTENNLTNTLTETTTFNNNSNNNCWENNLCSCRRFR